MLGAEADALPVVVTQAVAGFFNLNFTWLGATIRDAQRRGQLSSAQQAKALAELMLSTLWLGAEAYVAAAGRRWLAKRCCAAWPADQTRPKTAMSRLSA
ncbi:MAG: hypothetical protein ABIR27_02945 [Dokdonella sp.]